MQKHLANLKNRGLIQQWHDRNITPGQRISSAIRRHLDQADIVVFLFSPDFIDSTSCMDEWRYTKSLAEENPSLRRIPVILRPCAWQDVLDEDDILALPTNGRAISKFSDADDAWNDVYEGIKRVITDLGSTFHPKAEFLAEIDKSEFISQTHLKLKDLYVFPTITYIDIQSSNESFREQTIDSRDDLLTAKLNLVHGQDRIGKTALARHLYLDLIDAGEAVLLVDCAQHRSSRRSRLFARAFQEQFHGDFTRWLESPDKTLIIDNLSEHKDSLTIVEAARDAFHNIVAITPSDIFYSYYKDEEKLSDFRQLKIEPFNFVQQEMLIRKHLTVTSSEQRITDGVVDQIEGHVNAIIVSRHILPRYAFYILSILQTREAYMPGNMSITSYGHCYHALIVANLVRSGISESDDAVNACFNFAEQLAFATHLTKQQGVTAVVDFESFLEDYHSRFIIRESFINRLMHPTFGIINERGLFRSDYMYYFFLGKFLSRNTSEANEILADLCEHSHRESNYLTLLFTIHHTNDHSLIDDILLRTMCTLESVKAATLTRQETRRFSSVVSELPEEILSEEPVEESRRDQRSRHDEVNDDTAEAGVDDVDEVDEFEVVNGMYRILKNNKIMAQVLRNRYGSLERSRVEEIVEVISESGLRLVNLILADEEQIADWARYCHRQNPKWDLDMIKRALAYLSFIWTMVNIEEVVDAVNIPEIGGAVNTVVERQGTPAYDIIGYFRKLDSAHELTRAERDSLSSLLKKHKDIFVRRVASIRTQHYMNTHRSNQRIEQSVCDLLKIDYIPRALRGS